MSKHYVIAIGGTGMRCLESFVHLCAIGMFDNTEIDILTLDTDQTNGNKTRVENLIAAYNKVKEDKGSEGTPNAETFFSAKLNLYKFFTDYTNQDRKTYSLLSVPVPGLDNADKVKEDDEDLSALLLDPNVQTFNLEHGYRAQTHLGSLLMYHGIIEAMRNAVNNKDNAKEHEKDLAKFVKNLSNETDARVFVFGSIFGGTGASSIPVIPKALKDAASLDGNNTLDLSTVKFGSTLLTQYFKFPSPDKNQRDKEKVIATSDNFAINSQAALQFYQSDPTVIKYYKRFYHIGWPNEISFNFDNDGNTITGGAEQQNDCHIVELMSAAAAYDFFNLPDDALTNAATEYVYRSVEENDGFYRFSGRDFIDGEAGDMFAKKLGMFLSFAHLVLTLNEAAYGVLGTKAFIDFLNRQKIDAYNAFTDEQSKQIDDYMRLFAYEISSKEHKLVPGWIYQIQKSVGAHSFIFKPGAIETNTDKLRSIDPGNLFSDEKNNWGKGNQRKSYDKLADILTKTHPNDEVQHVNTLKERFIAHIFNGIKSAQNN